MIKALIFDCFGVLITDVLAGLIDELKTKKPDIAEQIIDAVKAADIGFMMRDESHKTISSLLGMTHEQYETYKRDGEMKNTLLLDYIQTLHKTYKTGLLSNVSGHGLEVRFSKKELEDHFDVVIASSDIGYAKPEARAYEITADRLGVRLNECIMIDDREDYCQGAVDVGMTAIQYKDFESLKTELSTLLP